MFKIKNLKFKYPNNKTNTIKGIDFEIKEGEIFGFLGPSGAGKSTTQRLLIKLLKDYEGDITYKGKSLIKYDDSFYEEIGVGFEMPISFSKLTALENLDFFKQLYKSNIDIENIIKKIGLWKDKDKKTGEYSKGMKIRLNFVRAMINNPKILFLDEPTSGLDPQNTKIIREIILKFKKDGGTVFLTTHVMNDVDALCDRVAFIANGEIKEIATPKELKLKYGKKIITVEYESNKKIIKKEFKMEEIKSENFSNLIKTKKIITIHSGETTLDEIFIKVTGVELDE